MPPKKSKANGAPVAPKKAPGKKAGVQNKAAATVTPTPTPIPVGVSAATPVTAEGTAPSSTTAVTAPTPGDSTSTSANAQSVPAASSSPLTAGAVQKAGDKSLKDDIFDGLDDLDNEKESENSFGSHSESSLSE
jgi:hypothetical protein